MNLIQHLGRLSSIFVDTAPIIYYIEAHNEYGPLKFHHEFRVTLADCPNACSQPQIKDMGILLRLYPRGRMYRVVVEQAGAEFRERLCAQAHELPIP